MRRLDRAVRQLGEPPLRGQRERVRRSGPPGRDDRPASTRPAPRSRSRSSAARRAPAGDHQPVEHGSRPHAPDGYAPALCLPQRAGRLLPDRQAELPPRRSATTRCTAARSRPSPGSWGCGGSTCSTTVDFLEWYSWRSRSGTQRRSSASRSPDRRRTTRRPPATPRSWTASPGSGADGVVLAGDPLRGRRQGAEGAARPVRHAHDDHGPVPLRLREGRARGHRPAVFGGCTSATGDLPRQALPAQRGRRQSLEDLGGASNEPFDPRGRRRPRRSCSTRSRARTGPARRCSKRCARAKVKRGILGTFDFDENGDITPAPMPIIRITGSTPPEAGLPPQFQGSVVAQRHPRAARARRVTQSNRLSCTYTGRAGFQMRRSSNAHSRIAGMTTSASRPGCERIHDRT